MSVTDTLVRWLGGVPAADAETLVQQRDTAERALDTARADLQARLVYLADADRRITTDAVRAAEARVVGELTDLRRIAAEKGARYACHYATCRVTWDAHELVKSNTYRFFTAPLGCTGAGFTRSLTIAETNAREAPPPPLAIRAVSVRVTLASLDDRERTYGDEEAGLHVAIVSALRRHCVLRLDMAQWVEDIGPLDGFDLEGGRVRPYSPPEHIEAAMRSNPRGWCVTLTTGQFRLPERVTIDIRIGLHGEPLPADEVHPALAPLLDDPDCARLRRIVHEEVKAALNTYPTRP